MHLGEVLYDKFSCFHAFGTSAAYCNSTVEEAKSYFPDWKDFIEEVTLTSGKACIW